MRAARKAILVIAGGIVALGVIAVFLAQLIFDVDFYKSKIESATSEATGLEVRIKGKVGFSFSPLGISFKDLHVTGKAGQILSVQQVKLGAELLPLLRRQLKVTDCELLRPAMTIMKDGQGKYNFESAERPKMGLRTFGRLNRLKLSEGMLVYLDKRAGEKTEFKKIDLMLKDFSVGDTSEDIIKNVSFTGSIACEELLKTPFRINRIKGEVRAEKGVFTVKPLTMDIFGAKGEGDASVDESSPNREYKITLKVSNLDFERLEESFGIEKVIGGKGDLAAVLAFKKSGSSGLLESMDGALSLRGENLITYAVDLDGFLSAYETSQEFSLIDIAVYFIVGPLGPLALKGYRYGNLYYQSLGGQGIIKELVSRWKISDGRAEATDCALSTPHNRVALKGKLNFVSGQYEDVTVALLDENGCAKFEQDISGPFDSPHVGVVSVVESLVDPILDLYRQANRLVLSEECKVFYSGVIKHPG